jgi:tetratricopeptide (TPR) repeat protein
MPSPGAGRPFPHTTDNHVDGRADTVLQAADIHGSVHFHQDHPTPPPVPRQLPVDAAHFTGRSSALAELDAQHLRGACVLITGPAGVGKTALAVRWSHARRDRFPDGDLYVDLHGYDLGTPAPLEQVFERLLRALGVASDAMPSDVESQATLYRSLLADRKALVVLDNATSADQLLTLLPGSPTCFVVVTSRHRLSPLLVRTGAARVTLDPLPSEEALSLLRVVIGASRVDGEPGVAAELARQCAHLPLALRIVADRAATHPYRTLAELAGELVVERDRLDVLTADDDESTAVRAVFSWSYQALPAPVSRLFRLLGLHPGSDLSTAAAAALVGLPVPSTARLLDALAGVHLLQETGRDRYRCHDLLRVYAAERAQVEESEAERTAAVRRVLDWYLRTANAADHLFNPLRRHVPLEPGGTHLDLPNHSAAVAWCEAERANLVAATRRAAELGHHDIAWRLPIALWGYFTLRTPWIDWVATYRTGLESARLLGDRRAEAWLLGGLGIAYRDLRRYPDALDSYDRAVTLAREVGDRYGEGWTLGSKGVALWELKRFDEALRCSGEALAVFRDLGDRYGEGQALCCFGEACRGLRRYDEALDYFLRSLRLRQEIHDRGGEAQTTHSLGDAYRDLGRLPEALDTYLAALAIWAETGDRWGEARTLTNLGDVLRHQGRAGDARAAWERSLAICDALGSPKAVEIRARLNQV